MTFWLPERSTLEQEICISSKGLVILYCFKLWLVMPQNFLIQKYVNSLYIKSWFRVCCEDCLEMKLWQGFHFALDVSKFLSFRSLSLVSDKPEMQAATLLQLFFKRYPVNVSVISMYND